MWKQKLNIEMPGYISTQRAASEKLSGHGVAGGILVTQICWVTSHGWLFHWAPNYHHAAGRSCAHCTETTHGHKILPILAAGRMHILLCFFQHE